MIKVKKLLNGLAFAFTVFLVVYGLNKGFDMIELFTYNIYFIVIIINLFINFFEMKKKG